MQLDGQAQPLGGLQHALGLRQREADAFAERVHRVHQPFVGQRGQHVVADLGDVVAGAAGDSACAPRKVVLTVTP